MNGHNLNPNTADHGIAGHGKYEGLSRRILVEENRRYADTGGVSKNNAGLGFRPAFYDTSTGKCYLSRFGDGRPAPFHMIKGLPADLFARRQMSDSTAALRPGVISGFVLGTRFYTREQAAEVAQKTLRH